MSTPSLRVNGIKFPDGSELISVGNFARRGLSVVADNTNNFNGSTKTVTTGGTYDTTRSIHTNQTGKTITSLVLVYANYGQASSTETGNPNQIQVQASVELSGTTTVQTNPRSIVFFNGLLTLTLDKRGIGYSQPIPCNIPAGASFYVRTAVTTPGNSQTVQRGICTRGTTGTFGVDNGEGLGGSVNRAYDGGGDVTASAATACYSPSLILGTLADGSIAPSVAILGDSIQAGTDDASYGYNYGGWAIRAFAGYPRAYLPIAGEKQSQVITLTNFYSRYELSGWCSTVIGCYGRNDLVNGDSAATIKANILTFAYMFMSRGQRYIQATILPAPTSTDGYKTTANQTKETTDAIRIAVNQWIRDTSGSGFVAQANAAVSGMTNAGSAKYVDACAAIECNAAGTLTTDGGYILPVNTVSDSGTATSATVGPPATLVDSTKTWTTNQYKGYVVYITGGTGSGQLRCIGYNTSTALGILNAWSVTPDATSTYQIYNGYGLNGVHPCTRANVAIAASITPASVVV